MNIQTDAGHSSPLPGQVIRLNTSQRIKRSLKGSGLFFGLAIASVFIPVFHFVLVPLFLILSIVVGFSRFKKINYIDMTNVRCPSCQHPLKESALYFNDEPQRLYCYECRNQLRIKTNP